MEAEAVKAEQEADAVAPEQATEDAILDARIRYHVAAVTRLLGQRAPGGSAVESVGWRVDDLGTSEGIRATGWAQGHVSGSHRMDYAPDHHPGWAVRETPRLHLGGAASSG